MAKQGVVNIGLNVDYQKSLQDMIKDFKTTLNQISSDFKKTSFAADLEAQVSELSKTMSTGFEKINNSKLDVKSFEDFKKTVESQLGEVETDVKKLQNSLNKLDGSSAVRKLVREFQELKNHVTNTTLGLSDFFNLANKLNNIENKGIVAEYESAIKAIEAYEKEYEKVYTDFGKLKPVKTGDLGAVDENSLYEQLEDKIKLYQTLRASYENMRKGTDISKLSVDDQVKNGLTELQANIAKTAVEINGLKAALTSLSGDQIGLGLTKDGLNSLNKAATEGFELESIKQRLIVAKSEISNLLNQTQAEVSSFELKDGAIRIPVDTVINTEELKGKLQDLIGNLQSYSQENPVRLTVSSNAIKEEVSTILTSIKTAIEETPFSIHLNNENLIDETKTSINSAINSVLTEHFSLSLSKDLDVLIAPLREVTELLSGKSDLNFGIDEASMERITGSIENIANMFKRAFGVASDSDIASQWSVIEGKFQSVAGEEGKLLAKNKEHKIAMQELAVEYQKYLDMGGANKFSDLTNHRHTIQNLSKAYEELSKSAQETAQKQAEQKTTSKTVNSDSEAIKSTTRANKSLETQANKTSVAIENEAKSAQSASEKFRKLAKEKDNATVANRELAKAAKETADALEREAKVRKKTENSRGSKNAVDGSVYYSNALQWQAKIKQELLDSGNYADVYNAKIGQTAKGNVSFSASVQTMSGEWKGFTATLNSSGGIVSSKIQDLSEKQVAAIEKAKEQARQLMEAYMAMASGEVAQQPFYNKSDMEEYLAYILETIQSLETLEAKYKLAMNSDGSVTITKTLTEANGEIKTFVANFKDIDTVLGAAMYPKKNFNAFLEENFDSGNFSTSGVSSATTQYEKLYEIAKKISSVKIKLAGLDATKDATQVDTLQSELEKLQQEYKELYAVATLDGIPEGFEKLNNVFTETERKTKVIRDGIQDAFVAKGQSALNSFIKKYSGWAGYDDLSSSLGRIREGIKGISSQKGLDTINTELDRLAQKLKQIKADNANNKLGSLISNQTFTDIKAVRANINSLLSSVGKVNEKSIRVKNMNSLTAEVEKANGEIHKMTVNLDSNGFVRYVDNGISQFGRLREYVSGVFNTIKSLSRMYLTPYAFIRYFKQGFNAVKEVDSALTELIKVSSASDSAIAKYFDSAVESTKELGSSVTDMISATADWARLGMNNAPLYSDI